MIILICIAVVYLIFLLNAAEKFMSLPETKITDSETQIHFSIVIPFRNEAGNLPSLFESLNQLNYPEQFAEIILVDDHSADNGKSIAEAWKHNRFVTKTISLSGTESGKKAALREGILAATGEYVITTDADCSFHPDWLHGFARQLQLKPLQLLAGAVRYHSTADSGFTGTYQVIENAGLVALGAPSLAAGHGFMANGANLCINKSAWIAVQGYEGNDHIASGDDEFLLLKIKDKFPGEISFLNHKNSVVKTQVQPGWKAFFQQRIRWAGKARYHKDKKVFEAQISLASFYLLIIILFFFQPFMVLPAVAIKCTADTLFYLRIRNWFGLSYPATDAIIASLLQIIVIPLVGVSTLLFPYQWKGRSYPH